MDAVLLNRQGKPKWLMKTGKIRKEIEKYTDRRFVQEGKRLPSELSECLAVKRRAGRQGANESSKEPTKAGRNNRSLARKTTSVVGSGWGLFVKE